MAASVDNIVEEIAVDENAHPFGASYVARNSGIALGDAYRRLEILASRHELERHFELISPFTGRTLLGFHLGDKVPIGETFEPEDEDEDPFIISKDDIRVTFSPTPQLRARLVAEGKKKHQAATRRPPAEGELLEALRAARRVLEETSRKIRSEMRERLTDSTKV